MGQLYFDFINENFEMGESPLKKIRLFSSKNSLLVLVTME